MGKRVWWVGIAIIVLTGFSSGQVLRYAELNTRQIEALDRGKTAIVIPSAPLEEHGPYLPSWSDGYWTERHAQDLAEAIAARPGWKAVLLPTIPLGCDGANFIGFRHYFTGSVMPRCNTIRDLFMDLGDALGEQGFKWIFLVDYHGAPNHNRALDLAGDYFRDTYGGQMVHLFGILPVRICCDLREKFLTPEQIKADGFSIHAGAEETSMLLALRPGLVAPDYRAAPDLAGADFTALMGVAAKRDWPGYFGSPRAGSAALGLAEYRAMVQATSDMTLKILNGFDYRTLPNFYNEAMKEPGESKVEDGSGDRRQEAKQKAWLKKRGL